MKTLNLIAAVTIALGIILHFPNNAFAVSTPDFPACANPQGTQIDNYSSGSHGIVGESEEKSGSDAVYSLSDRALIQCFCATNGDGIQTNWFKADDLSENDIKILKNEGWIYIPDGSAWGLENVAYLAKNSSYSCGGEVGGASDDNSSNNSNNNNSSSNNNNSGGSVLSASTTSSGDILGLANTGNLQAIIVLFVAGLSSLSLGLLLKITSKK